MVECRIAYAATWILGVAIPTSSAIPNSCCWPVGLVWGQIQRLRKFLGRGQAGRGL